MKILIFLPQHIFQFSNMADQKTFQNKLFTLSGGFRDRGKTFLRMKIGIFLPQHIFQFSNMVDQKTF